MIKVWGARKGTSKRTPRVARRTAAGAVAVLLGLSTVGVGLMSTASATDGGNGASVCPSGDGWYKTDLRGEQTSFTHKAPEGYEITAVCAKSASFLPLFQQTLNPGVKAYTFTSAASGFGTKAISHVSVKKEKITTSTPGTPVDCEAPATPNPDKPGECQTPAPPIEPGNPGTPDEPGNPDEPGDTDNGVDVPVTGPDTGVNNPPVVAPNEQVKNPGGKNPNGQPGTTPAVKGVEAEAPAFAPAVAAVPTAVDAGVLTPGSDESNRALTLMVLGMLLAVAGAVFGFVPAPSRGKFQH